MMASFQLAGLDTSVDVVVFSAKYDGLQARIGNSSIVAVDGRVDGQDGRLRLVADAILTVDEARAKAPPSGSNGKRNGKNGRNGNPALPGPTVSLTSDSPPRHVRIEVTRTSDRAADLDRVVAVYAVIQRHPGQDEVELFVAAPGGKPRSVPLPDRRVQWSDRLEEELRTVLGDGRVRVSSPEPAARAPEVD